MARSTVGVLVVLLALASAVDIAHAEDRDAPPIGFSEFDVAPPAADGKVFHRHSYSPRALDRSLVLCSADGEGETDTDGAADTDAAVEAPEVPEAPDGLAEPTFSAAAVQVAPVTQGPRKRWSAMFGLYLWATDISGTSWADGQATDIEADFSDLFDKLKYAIMGYAEYRYDRFSIAVDASVLALETTRPGVRAPLTAELDQTLIDVRLGYQIFCRQVGSAQWGRCCYPRHLTVDAVVGARYWRLEQKIQVALPAGGTVSRSSKENWFDPYVGARLRWQFAKRWSVMAYGDIGGFGINDGSELTWQLQGNLRYNITHGFFVTLGYRHLDVDRVTGSGATQNGVDAAYSGPLLGVGFSL